MKKTSRRKTFKIRVTQKDIDDGMRGNCRYCPVALAAQRAGIALPVVSKSEISALGHETHRVADLPTRAQNFIRAFDDYLNVKPFAFQVTL